MQLFKTDMVDFHPPQRGGAYRSRGPRLRFGCRSSRTGIARPDASGSEPLQAQYESPGQHTFPAADTIVVGLDDDGAFPHLMDRAA